MEVDHSIHITLGTAAGARVVSVIPTMEVVLLPPVASVGVAILSQS